MVEPGSILYSDEWGGYRTLDGDYEHRTIRHRDRIYVDGTTHTQTVEGFFGSSKNAIRGVYHGKHHAIQPAFVAPHSFRIAFVYDDFVTATSKTVEVESREKIEDDTEIARVRLPAKPGARKVEVKPTLSLALMFGDDSESASYDEATAPVLTWVRDDVLARLEPILRRLG